MLTIKSDEEDEPPSIKEIKASTRVSGGSKNVGALQVAMLTFFMTTGGPFGSEPAIAAGGMLYTLIGFILIPLVWSLPQALMSAELSMMFPTNGGPIYWVYHSFGSLAGWVNAYNTIVYYFMCNCLIVSLFTLYFEQLTSFWAITGVRFGLMLVVGFLNLFALDWIAYVSGLLLVLVELPFYVLFIVILVRGEVHPLDLFDRMPADEMDWPLFISITTWCFGGYDSLGSLAGDVRGPVSFVAGLAISLPLTLLNYLVPLSVCYLADPYPENWEEGHYSDVAKNTAVWLGVCMIAASALSNFGQVNAGTTSLVRLLWAMGGGGNAVSETQSPSVVDPPLVPEKDEEETPLKFHEHHVGIVKSPSVSLPSLLEEHPEDSASIEPKAEGNLSESSKQLLYSTSALEADKVVPPLPEFYYDSEVTGLDEAWIPGCFSYSVNLYPLQSPWVSVIVASFLTALIASLVDFSYMVELTTSMRVLQLVLEYSALTYLRWKSPDHPRPFKIPFSYFGVIGLSIPTLAICVLLITVQDWDVTFVGFGINVIFILMYYIHHLRRYTMDNIWQVVEIIRNRRKPSNKEESQV